MENINTNNAGTSWPKAPGVADAACAALAAPPEASRQVIPSARAEVCTALGIVQPERLLLTGSCTAALALAIADLPLQAGDVAALDQQLHQRVDLRGAQHLGHQIDVAFDERARGFW